MPPYHWAAIVASGYDILKQRLKYAANFYDLYRIDHFVGLFRVWAFPRSGSSGEKKPAAFDPPSEASWGAQARAILDAMLEKNLMLPCAEDLGAVPEEAKTVLKEYSIPGMEVQRWMRDWETSLDFRQPESYRLHSVATLSTHDMSPFENWWLFEAGTVEASLVRWRFTQRGLSFEAEAPKLFENILGVHGRLRWKDTIREASLLPELLGRPKDELWEIMELFRSTADERDKFLRFLGYQGRDPNEIPIRDLIERALERAAQSTSIFSIQLVQDLLALDRVFGPADREARLNLPGVMDERNWRLRVPISLKKMRSLPGNALIRRINETGTRT